MRKVLIALFCHLFCFSFLLGQGGDRYAYIDKYKDIAIAEMERSGVPASIKLAQGILESNAGNSYLARKANNHFGMKCGSQWEGKKVYREDDDYDANGRLIKSCFRAYKSAEGSYIAHSDFLRDPRKERRYGFLFRLDPYDYKRWAHGLKMAGYATSATYAEKLISVIETYELYKYDRMNKLEVIADNPQTEAGQEKAQGVVRQNDVKLVLARPGETPNDIAVRTGNSVKSILKWNEGLKGAKQRLQEDTPVYIQPKRRNYRGREKYHYVKAGESLYDIGQLYGVRVKNLAKRNRLPKGANPAVGTKIKLRGWKISESEKAEYTGGKSQNWANDWTEEPDNDNSNEDNTDFEDDGFGANNTNTSPVNNNSNTNNPRPQRPTNRPIDNNNGNSINPTNENEGTYVPVLSGGTVSSGSDDGDIIIIYPDGSSTTVINGGSLPSSGTGNTGSLPNSTGSGTTSPTGAIQYHTIVSGDTLWALSRKYGVTVQELMEWNGLTSSDIKKGQKLRVK